MKTMIYAGVAALLGGVLLAGCAKEDFGPDPQKDWAGTTYFFESADEAAFQTYYNPAVGRCGDPMPFYDSKAGEFKVLYLQEHVKNGPNYHPFWGVSTKDGASYVSLGEVLPTGESALEQDAALGTGCCIWDDATKLYHIYYTGRCDGGTNKEVVMRATSADFKTWTKDLTWLLKGDDFGFAKHDFRDPQLFKDDAGLWHMVISTKPLNGGDPRFAEFTSSDLKEWASAGSFNMIWDRMLECPDVFKMGSWWYLVYSESLKTDWSRKVKYMMAPSWDELKACFSDPGAHWPADGKEGILDSRGFYAGKTASNGTDRYIWGWCPYRIGSSIHEKNVNTGYGDGNEPCWSGSLVCHKIIQHQDGTLTLGEVPSIAAKYNQPQTVKEMVKDEAYTLYNRLGAHNHISLTVKTEGNWDKFGISLVRGSDSKKYYTMVVNPEDENWRKVNFEQEGPWKEGDPEEDKPQGFVRAIDSYGFARPGDNTYKIDIYTDNSVMVMYINDNVCYTNRIYGIQKNCWSVNNYGGSVTVSDVKVYQY